MSAQGLSVARSLGRRVSARGRAWLGPGPEAWLESDTDPEPDVPQLLNRHARPNRLGYRRAPQGDDKRLKYIVGYLDVRGQRVLELGPLYAYYTLLLDKLGASEIVAVESREQNVEICEEVKSRY